MISPDSRGAELQHEARLVLHQIAGQILRQIQQDNAATRSYRDWEVFCKQLTGLAVPAGAALTAELGCLLEGARDLNPAEVLFAFQSAFVLFCHWSVAHVLHANTTEVHQEVIGGKVWVSSAHPLFR